MFKTLILLWLIIQLFASAFAATITHNQITNKTFNCNQTEEMSLWIAIAVPLAFFIPENNLHLNEYCPNNHINFTSIQK